MSTRRKRNGRAREEERESHPLSERDILNTALDMIRRDGGEKFSMRALATELGVTPMAIYHHLPSKAALVRKLGDLVLANVVLSTPTGTHWQSEFRNYALEGWSRLAAHPGLTDLMLKQSPTRHQRQMIAHGIAILVAGGVSPRVAGLAITTHNMFFYGVMSTQAQLSKTPPKPAAGKPDRYANYLHSLDFRELAEYGINSIIAGLQAQLQITQVGETRTEAPQRSASAMPITAAQRVLRKATNRSRSVS